MRTSTKSWTIGLAATMLASAAALAQHGGAGPHGDEPELHAHLLKALGLSEEQRSRVRELTQSRMDGVLGEKLAALHEARGALGAQIHDPAASDEQVLEAAGAVSAIEAELAVERHHLAIEIQALLTPEQRQKAAQLMHEHPEGPHGRLHEDPGGS